MSLEFLLALLGTLFLFAETLAYIATGLSDNSYIAPTILSTIGLLLFLSGCSLHAWSVNVRGQHSVSWTMPENHELVKSAPYSMVRHPSYLSYMLMIIGVTLIWRTWFTLIPWVAIPGYYMVSRREEQLLIKQFGEEYREYMKKVGGFIPKI
jgi:protein-S-isoprenylcysteine O-methyltransferase Ste14